GTGGEAKAHDGLRRPERFPVVRGKRCWWPWPATRKTAARRPWATPSAALRRPWHIRFSFRPQPGRGAPAAVVIVTSPRPGIAVARRLRNSGAIPSTVRDMTQAPRITLIGGGLVGALLARQLAQHGFAVEVFEKRPDPRRAGFLGGRSINLALAERGLQALRTAGLADEVLLRAVMMRGRMVHATNGTSGLQRYGVDDSEVIWSVSRGALNMLLLDAAEASGVRFHFGQSLLDADFERRRIRLADEDGTLREHDADLLIGADGAGSALRAAMNAHAPLGERIEPLGHGYKELEIPAADTLPPELAQQAGGQGCFALE